MGDPAGIGPEITAKLMAMADLPARAIVVGDAGVMRRMVKALGLDLDVRKIESLDQVLLAAGEIEILQVGPALLDPPVGRVDAGCGAAAYAYIRSAIELARAGAVSAIVTAPINKEALSAAGVPYPGHTEMLADFGGAERVAMMLANNELRVVLVTIHCSLREAIDKVTIESVLDAIQLAHSGTRRFGISAPRVAVAGLNPHAGEGGLFGREEIEIIAPAIAKARDEGIDASGPWPGDTVFMQARQGRFDVVVAQYHDQGLIPVKYMGLDEGVNVTLGLPFIRTSPDHGTAFDIAGKGIADAASMRAALVQAARLVEAQAREEAA